MLTVVCFYALVADFGFWFCLNPLKTVFGIWNFVEQFRGTMSLLCSPNFKFSNDEVKKYPDFMDCDSTNNHVSQQENPNSAPHSLFASLVNGTEGFDSNNNGGGGREDYRFIRSSSPGVEAFLSRFMASYNEETFDSGSDERAVKQEMGESVRQHNEFCNQSSSMVNSAGGAQIGNLFRVMNSSDYGARNSANLFRQSSSPAGFFSNLAPQNGMKSLFGLCFGSCSFILVKFLAPNLNLVWFLVKIWIASSSCTL